MRWFVVQTNAVRLKRSSVIAESHKPQSYPAWEFAAHIDAQAAACAGWLANPTQCFHFHLQKRPAPLVHVLGVRFALQIFGLRSSLHWCSTKRKQSGVQTRIEFCDRRAPARRLVSQMSEGWTGSSRARARVVLAWACVRVGWRVCRLGWTGVGLAWVASMLIR